MRSRKPGVEFASIRTLLQIGALGAVLALAAASPAAASPHPAKPLKPLKPLKALPGPAAATLKSAGTPPASPYARAAAQRAAAGLPPPGHAQPRAHTPPAA